MVITYHGNGCFRIQSGPLSLLVDPQNARMKPDIFIKTLVPWPPKGEEDARGITGPGEYEQKGVRIWGFPVREESDTKFLKTMYVVEMEELRLVPRPPLFGAQPGRVRGVRRDRHPLRPRGRQAVPLARSGREARKTVVAHDRDPQLRKIAQGIRQGTGAGRGGTGRQAHY